MNDSHKSKHRALADQVRHIIGIYHQGVICPSEAWHTLADAVEQAADEEKEAPLAEELLQQLKACIDDRPESYKGAYNKRPQLLHYISDKLYPE